ncbi:EAL domain-containing protein [Undibacterium flavidum]|uniref:EAL domain-containing protein n=1 Tax=Undibacterium flavidum TaxID=2762297 RepID=A0ABR6YAU4_9BURK|nr:EAL domain-containing protein [Undibacterium flavidum]MBC3873322.1 EAL domain-containing protein [Undibacterium flavidum]
MVANIDVTLKDFLEHKLGIHHSHLAGVSTVLQWIVLLGIVQVVSYFIPTPENYYGMEHYLVLHTTMEIISIFISLMVFVVAWNSRDSGYPHSLTVLSSLFFVVSFLDLSHTLSYPGMAKFFTENDTNKYLNFWMAARFIATLGLLTFALQSFERMTKRSVKYVMFLSVLTASVVFSWLVVVHEDYFPIWFIPGSGLTPLKKDLEYLIIALNIVTAVILWKRLKSPQVLDISLVWGAVCVMAMGEFFFTLYTTKTGAYNVLGHLYKVIAYILIYRAVVVESIERPYRELEASQQNLELTVTASNTGLWDLNWITKETMFSAVWKQQVGYAAHELANHYDTWLMLLHPDDRQTAVDVFELFMNTPSMTKYENEFRLRHKDGSYRWIFSRGEKIKANNGAVERVLGSHTDITARKIEEGRFRSAVQASPNAMIMVNAKGIIVLTNSQTESMFDYTDGGLVGLHLNNLVPSAVQDNHQRNFEEYMQAPEDRAMGQGRLLFARRRNGDEFRVEIGLTPIAAQDGNYVLASVVDITAKIEAERRIEKLINYDLLTELPNRQLMMDRMQHAMTAAQRSGSRLALLYMNLDRFKHINDTLGHNAGDALLIEIAKRLTSIIKPTDTVARIAGDEFALVLEDVNEDEVARMAGKVLEVVAKGFLFEGQEVVLTPSIGIAMFPQDGADGESLFLSADTAMNKVKEDGRNDFRFFAKAMQQRTTRMLQLESAMHYALERNQFQLVYQPQMTMDGKTVIGVEALLRWTHPELGFISPAEFIPLAESNGQIIPIGAWVLRTALLQLKAWIEVGLKPMIMAVNLSAIQFRHPNLQGVVTGILNEVALPPEYLELELTESVATADPVNAIAVMNELHSLGIRLAIDDFGTGYSSLSYLKKFKVYKLKIDQSFVRDIATDSDDRAIVSAIIQMSKGLGFKTIAEGVETQAQSDFLMAQGCDEFQGYIFSKPLPAEQVLELIRKHQSRA